jgi:hypothetical protein
MACLSMQNYTRLAKPLGRSQSTPEVTQPHTVTALVTQVTQPRTVTVCLNTASKKNTARACEEHEALTSKVAD